MERLRRFHEQVAFAAYDLFVQQHPKWARLGPTRAARLISGAYTLFLFAVVSTLLRDSTARLVAAGVLVVVGAAIAIRTQTSVERMRDEWWPALERSAPGACDGWRTQWRWRLFGTLTVAFGSLPIAVVILWPR
jgi:hypothetical protein